MPKMRLSFKTWVSRFGWAAIPTTAPKRCPKPRLNRASNRAQNLHQSNTKTIPKPLPIFLGHKAPLLNARARGLGIISEKGLGNSGKRWLPWMLFESWALTDGFGKALEFASSLSDPQGSFWEDPKWLWEGPGRSSGKSRAPSGSEIDYIHKMAQLCKRMQQKM